MDDRNWDLWHLVTKGGGIDLTTGYSRRSMINMPWLDIRRPVDIDDLPDYNKFIAGKFIKFLSKLKIIKDEKISRKKWNKHLDEFHTSALQLRKNKAIFIKLNPTVQNNLDSDILTL
jgi:hypothetical protein